MSGEGISSSNVSWLPIRDTMPRLTTCADSPADFTALDSNGCFDLPLSRPPITYGRRVSPNSNPTSTSSPTSGRNRLPHSLPMPTCTTRAQSLS